MVSEQIDFSQLLEVLPPIVWRSNWNELARKTGLPYRRGYMQNLDSEGKGPRKMIFNRRVAYKREDLISWLNDRQGGGM